SGGPSVTIIDGNNQASDVTFTSSETTASVIDGFTITHGFDAFHGGGITVIQSSPTIQNNVITGNDGLQGLGIYVSFGSPMITGNTITGNVQSGGSGGIGGGIAIGGASNAQVIGNTISNNQFG